MLLYDTDPLTERNRSTRPVPGASVTDGGSAPAPLGCVMLAGGTDVLPER